MVSGWLMSPIDMPAKSTDETLPEQWRAAYERDRLSPADYADPAPERRAARMLAEFILTGLCFLGLPGTLLGVWNLLSIAGHHATSAVSIAWTQAHGQAQLFGWVGTFILGISLYVLPRPSIAALWYRLGRLGVVERRRDLAMVGRGQCSSLAAGSGRFRSA